MITSESLDYKIAVELLRDNVGNKYRLDMSSLSGGSDFTVSSGVISEVIEKANTISIRPEGYDYCENFTLGRLKQFSFKDGNGYHMIKVLYNDGSYFKIYIMESE